MNDHKAILAEVKRVPSATERSARAIRLKNELNLILELVVHSRESLANELDSEFAQRKLSIDKPFLAKLKELTSCYNSLTDARIRLDKAEKSMEKEMTPSEEKEAVRLFVASLDGNERSRFVRQMWAEYQATTKTGVGRPAKDLPGAAE